MNTDEINNKIDNITKLVNQLQKEKENLKCCGNCMHNIVFDMGDSRDESCEVCSDADSSGDYCSQWGYDKLTKNDRIINEK